MVSISVISRCIEYLLENHGFKVEGIYVEKYYTEASETIRAKIIVNNKTLVFKLKGYVLKTLMVLKSGGVEVRISISRDLDDISDEEICKRIDELVRKYINKIGVANV